MRHLLSLAVRKFRKKVKNYPPYWLLVVIGETFSGSTTGGTLTLVMPKQILMIIDLHSQGPLEAFY